MMGTRRAALVGREAELSALQRAAASARDGQGGLVLVHGEAGIGKSRLCRDFAASVGHALHLRGQAFPGDDTVAHAILVDTLRAARRDSASAWWATAQRRASVLGAVVPELLEAEHAAVQFDDETRIFETVLDIVDDVAAGRLVVWLVEDIQWADPASWRFLHYGSRRAPSMRLLVLATFRDDESVPDDPAWTRLVMPGSREGTERLGLERLSPSDTERLVLELCGTSVADTDLRAVVERSEGTPLLVEELVAMSGTVGTRRGTVPEVVRLTARERARKAGTNSRALLDLAAVMGHDADLDLLVDLRPDQAMAVDSLVDAGLLTSAGDGRAVEFRHPLLREAVYEEIPWERRRRLHAEAAAALTDHASVQSVERIARHWELAGRPDEALACLREVIDAAHRQDNLHRAAALGVLAIALIDRHERLRPQRERTVQPLIEDLFLTGNWTPLLPLVWEAVGVIARDDPRRPRLVAILAQGEVQNLGKAILDVGRLIHDALTAAGDTATPDTALLHHSLGLIAWIHLDLPRALEHAEQAERAATACGVLEIEIRARILRAWVDLGMGVSRDQVRADMVGAVSDARAAHLGPREASALLQVARISLDAVDIRRAEEAGRSSARWYELGAQLLRGFVFAFAGRAAEALEILTELPSLVDIGRQALWTALMGRCLVLLMQGYPRQAREVIAEMREVSAAISNLQGDELTLSGWAAWEEGDVSAAAAAFDQSLAALKGSRLEPGYAGPYFIALHVDALMRAGRTADARSVLTAQSPREDRSDADRYTVAAFAAARLRLQPSAERLTAALDACRAADWPWLEGLCAAWGAELLGDPASAAHARRLWHQVGYGPGVARMDMVIARDAHREEPELGRLLTAREAEVADLIAEGLTNAQIGERLGISTVTVAHHVSSVLDKLGVASRTQVAVLRARRSD
jgi:DNA-binding NarL/FixJ family response regulator